MRPLARVGAALVIATLALAGCGKASEETAAFAEPAVAAPDLVEVGNVLFREEFANNGLDLSLLPADAVLVGPHHAVALVGVVTTPELTRDQLRALGLRGLHDDPDTPLQAGPGQEFLLVYFGEPKTGGVPASDKASAEVEVAGEVRPLSRVPMPYEVLLLNVPAGEDAILVTTDASQVASISLRTGQRIGQPTGDPAGGGPHPADRLVGDSLELEDLIRVPGLSQDPGEVLTAKVAVRPYSYLDDRGAPAEGHMWLRVEFELWAITCDWCVAGNATVSLDLARSLSIHTSDGEELSIPADAEVELAFTQPFGHQVWQWHGFYEVPDTVRVLEVWYETHATFTRPDGGTFSYERITGDTTGTLELTEE